MIGNGGEVKYGIKFNRLNQESNLLPESNLFGFFEHLDLRAYSRLCDMDRK